MAKPSERLASAGKQQIPAPFSTMPISSRALRLRLRRAIEWAGSGGETGIRTLVRVSPKHAFQACAFSHSAISPARIVREDRLRKRNLLLQKRSFQARRFLY